MQHIHITFPLDQFHARVAAFEAQCAAQQPALTLLDFGASYKQAVGYLVLAWADEVDASFIRHLTADHTIVDFSVYSLPGSSADPFDTLTPAPERSRPPLTEHEYVVEVMRTYAGSQMLPDQLCLGALGLAGESGEVVDAVKKTLFQGHDLDCTKLADELGDVLWYLTLLSQALGYSLPQLMQLNVDKLRRRYPNGFSRARSIHRAAEQGATAP